MNFFDPLSTYDGKPFKREKYKSIIQEQVILSYLTKGGVTYGDSEMMTPHEREIALSAIKEILKVQSENQAKAVQEAKSANPNKTPKTLHR